jgi:uncharacterized protein YkwD
MTLSRLGPLFCLLALAGCGSLGLLSGVGETAASLNEFRQANGLKPLQQDAGLTAMAAAHSADMARRETLDHGGFREQRGPRGARAENVAYGCNDTPCTIQQWIKSSGHRANMLRADVGRYGLGSAVSKSGRKYWTLLVGE